MLRMEQISTTLSPDTRKRYMHHYLPAVLDR